MKSTEQEINEAAKKSWETKTNHPIYKKNGINPYAYILGYKSGFNDAISQMQPDWVAIDSFLTVIENGLSEHIALLKEVNKGNQFNNIDMWDYQTAAESNEAILELRKLYPKPTDQ